MNIFIIEDDRVLRTELMKMLCSYGYQCDYSEDWQSIVRIALQASPDLILLDINLPLFDGFHICREIRKQSEVPIIVVTSRSTDNGYAILYDIESNQALANQFYDKNISLTIGKNALSPAVAAEMFILSNNGRRQITFVIADAFMNAMNIRESVWNVQCVSDEAVNDFSALLDNYLQESGRESAFVHYTTRQQIYEASVTTKAIVAFLAIYLGIVFMITCAAILAIQQLSEAADNVERYNLLKKLGVERRELDRALLLQILCYFLMPLLLAVIHAVVGLTAANEAIKMFGNIEPTSTILATSVFIVLVYGVYFLLTYVGSKNVIHKE